MVDKFVTLGVIRRSTKTRKTGTSVTMDWAGRQVAAVTQTDITEAQTEAGKSIPEDTALTSIGRIPTRPTSS